MIEEVGNDLEDDDLSEDLTLVTGQTKIYDVTLKEAEGLARRAVDLIAGGESPEMAIELAGGHREMLKNPTLKRVFDLLKTEGTVSADVQRAIVRGLDFTAYQKLMLKGLEALDIDGDPSILKEALPYGKVIRADPAIGLTAPPVTQVNIDMTPLRAVIERQTQTPEETFEWLDEEKGETK